ncbi:MAG TPA: hypothetical protein VF466_05150 [Candidatus Saccharimonadales bacterium]
MSELPAFANYVPDDRSVCYRRAGDVVTHVVAKSGVDVDELTQERWRECAGLMREYDTFADEVCPDNGQALAVLRDFSLFAPRYPELRPDSLGQPAFDTVADHVQTILHLGGLIATETSVDRYIDLRKEEAAYTVRAFGAAATSHVQQQDAFPAAMQRVTALSITANMGDSILDARGDFQTGKSQLPPSWELYKKLLLEAARSGKPHIGYVLDGEGVKLRAKMIRDRVVNRVRHGVTPYSNLHVAMSFLRGRQAHPGQ